MGKPSLSNAKVMPASSLGIIPLSIEEKAVWALLRAESRRMAGLPAEADAEDKEKPANIAESMDAVESASTFQPLPEEDITNKLEKLADDGSHKPKKKKMDGQKAVATTDASRGAIPKRKKPPNDQTGSSASNNLLQSNKFALLPEDQGDPIPPPAVPSLKERVPPIFTTIKDVSKLRAALANHGLLTRFQLCRTGTKIVCSTLHDHTSVKALLKEYRFPFYSHDVPSSKPLKVVLRGLPVYEAEEVKAELKSLGLNPLEVYPMIRHGQKNNSTSYRDQLYLIHFPKGSTTIGALRNHRDLFQVIVKWEPYRAQHRDVTQCTNCLAFGHGKRNCYMYTRCSKCAGSHRTKDCNQKKDEEPKCFNCGQNHLATTRACPKRAEFIEIRQRTSAGNQPGRHRKPQPKPQPQPKPKPQPPPGLSFAGVTAGSFAGAPAGDNDDDAPLSTEELVQIITAAIKIKAKYTTRSQQLAAIVALIDGP